MIRVRTIYNYVSIGKHGQTAYNRIVTGRRLKRRGYEKHQSGFQPFVVFFSATLPAPANLTVCFIGGCQRQLQPER
jgi:hypothetical protein